MRRFIIGTVAVLALAAAGSATAGGWATVGVSPQPEESDWQPTLTVLQHGRTPLDGVKPTITIHNEATGETKSFPATPTGEPGKYSAKVVFPAGGTWRYEINDGFSQTHTFAPITIPGAAGPESSFPVWTVTGIVALGLALAALLLFGLRMRRRPGLAAVSPR
ncbi:MAG: FixH family protein [Gaiellaceae bacterium]